MYVQHNYLGSPEQYQVFLGIFQDTSKIYFRLARRMSMYQLVTRNVPMEAKLYINIKISKNSC